MNKDNKAKARKVFLTDQEYEPLHEQAENAALSFSAYARNVLLSQEVSTEAPLRQAVCELLCRYINLVNVYVLDPEAKNKFIELENELWQSIK